MRRQERPIITDDGYQRRNMESRRRNSLHLFSEWTGLHRSLDNSAPSPVRTTTNLTNDSIASFFANNDEGDILDLLSTQTATGENGQTQLHQILQGGFNPIEDNKAERIGSGNQQNEYSDSMTAAVKDVKISRNNNKKKKCIRFNNEIDDEFFKDQHTGDDIATFRRIFGSEYDPFDFFKAELELINPNFNFLPALDEKNKFRNTSIPCEMNLETEEQTAAQEIEVFDSNERRWSRQELESILADGLIDWSIDAPATALNTNAVGDNALIFKSLEQGETPANNIWLRHGMTFDILPNKKEYERIVNNPEAAELSRLLEGEEITKPKPGRNYSWPVDLSVLPSHLRNNDEIPYVPSCFENENNPNQFLRIVNKEGNTYSAYIQGKLFVGTSIVPLNSRFIGLGGRSWVLWKPAEHRDNILLDPSSREEPVPYGPVVYSSHYAGPHIRQIGWMLPRGFNPSSSHYGLNQNWSGIRLPNESSSSGNILAMPSYGNRRDFELYAYDRMQTHLYTQYSRLGLRNSRIFNATEIYYNKYKNYQKAKREGVDSLGNATVVCDKSLEILELVSQPLLPGEPVGGGTNDTETISEQPQNLDRTLNQAGTGGLLQIEEVSEQISDMSTENRPNDNIETEQSTDQEKSKLPRSSQLYNARNDAFEFDLGYSTAGAPFTNMFITGIRHRDGDMFLAESIFRCYKVGKSLIMASENPDNQLRTQIDLSSEDWSRIQSMFLQNNFVSEVDLQWLLELHFATPMISGVIARLKPSEASWRGAVPVMTMI